jgi:putative heme-binding domain-containing protein
MPRPRLQMIAFAALLAALVTGVSAQQGNKKAEAPKAPAKPAKATAAESLKVAKGFQAELIYTVPAEQFGSWVNICTDPKGRLIVSDQYGKLYRVTPPAVGTKGEPAIEVIPAAIGAAQGLCWAFDSLYVVVNSGNPPSGLYRVFSSQNNDTLDKVELLKPLQGGGGEHGPHAVIPHPDGKRLTVVCGNQTKLVDYTSSRVPPHWGEDHLLPRMPDGRGFMKGVNGPGGAIYNVTPDGKQWELQCVGFRNQYDAAYNRNGDLFTYDADMEWDFNTPWYRPTRVCQVFSGGEYGWRNGAGKYPAYYADNLPPVVNIGPGSPTGVCFGYGAKFPKKYQEAFFICDWSYGKLYALHMSPDRSTYKADVEEFVAGTPLPLTDVIINPTDGAMYFLIGGRKTQSALYRVTATNPEDPVKSVVEASDEPAGMDHTAARKFCEKYHGTTAKNEDLAGIIDFLKSQDRVVRFSARVALEWQDRGRWEKTVLDATDDNMIINGLLALVRASAPCPNHAKPTSPKANPALGAKILAQLNSVNIAKLTEEQRLDLIRVYHVLFNRYGTPAADGRSATLAKFEAVFPTGSNFVDRELAQVLVYLESPTAAAKIVKQLLAAPTQEEQIDYARALRVLKGGWTPELRKDYFTWMQKADGYRGGNSFGGFLSQIRSDALTHLNVHDRAAIQSLLEVKRATGPVQPKRTKVVKQYTMADLEPLLETKLKSGRNFENGRTMFAEAMCAACHRYDNEGGISGPDLTQAAGRFSPKDLLTSIIEPNKEISDQYAAVEIVTDDGAKVVGRIVNHRPTAIVVNTNMLDPSASVDVKSSAIESIKPSKISMMPGGTLDTLTEDEVLDLMAYLLSRGNKNNSMFKK